MKLIFKFKSAFVTDEVYRSSNGLGDMFKYEYAYRKPSYETALQGYL